LTSPDAPKIFKFEDQYSLQQRIAKGSFGIVYVSKHKETGEEYAVKVIDREKLTSKDNDGVIREVTILKDCTDVLHIVRLVDFFSSPNIFYVVQVYAQGGDVFDRLANRTSYTEKDARDLAMHLLEAMQTLHSRRLAHRDLKPENLLLHSMLDDASILVADFGFAAYVPDEGLKTRCGTPAFVAPEVVVQNCRYDEQVDMWSVGCLLYMLLGGYPPFQDKTHRGLFRKIRGADYCFHEAYWKNVSISAKQLISSLLTTDPKYRCTADMALRKSNWLKIRDKKLQDNDLSTSLGEIRKFQARQSLKGAMHAVRWSIRSRFKSASEADFADQMKTWDKDDEAQQRVDNALLTKYRPTLRFSDVYLLKKKLHASQSAEVWECVHKKRNEAFAVKVIERKKQQRKSVTGKSLEESVLHELAVLKALKHKYIIDIVDFFDEDDYVYLIMELMTGGDVFDRITSLQKYTEKDARDLAKILLEAVSYMHGESIAHRDLKPQNLLLKSKDDHASIKIADFGFACRVHTAQSLTTRCGTPSYVAPEILKNIPYDQTADMWSVGVILFILLCGNPPFADNDQKVLFQKIRMGEWMFNENDWKDVSEDAKDLIRNLLVVNPLRRWTAKECLRSKWLNEGDEQLSAKDLSQTAQVMRQRKLRLRHVAQTIIWMNQRGQSARQLEPMEEVMGSEEEDPEAEAAREMAAREEILARSESDVEMAIV